MGKKPLRSMWRISSLIFRFSSTTPPDVNERLPTRQENGIMEWKLAMAPRRGGILPPRHKITMSLPTFGTRNDTCLTATHKHSAHGSTWRVKNNIAVPAGKLHREFRHKELEIGLLPLARCATSSLIPDVVTRTDWVGIKTNNSTMKQFLKQNSFSNDWIGSFLVDGYDLGFGFLQPPTTLT